MADFADAMLGYATLNQEPASEGNKAANESADAQLALEKTASEGNKAANEPAVALPAKKVRTHGGEPTKASEKDSAINRKNFLTRKERGGTELTDDEKADLARLRSRFGRAVHKAVVEPVNRHTTQEVQGLKRELTELKEAILTKKKAKKTEKKDRGCETRPAPGSSCPRLPQGLRFTSDSHHVTWM